MTIRNLRIITGGILLLSAQLALASAPMLNIIPSTLSLTTRSDGSTSVIYTVTSNLTHSAVTNLKINPYYHSSSAAGSLTLQNDTCSGSTLSPSASCQFGIVISGANQANSFKLNPSVCNGNQQICSTTTSSNSLNVNVYQISQDPYAYFGVAPAINQHGLGVPPSATELLPINALTNSFGTPVTNLDLAGTQEFGSIAVALDGSRVYAVERPNDHNPDGAADIAVLSAGANSQLLQRIVLPGFTTTADMFIVVAPNGQTLYVSATDYGSLNAVYSIDLMTNVITTLPESFTNPLNLALSPDGSRLYVANYARYSSSDSSVSVINTANNTLVTTLTNDLTNPNSIAVSPDGSKLYISNLGTPSIATYAIGPNDSYTPGTAIHSADNNALSISSDGNYLYVSHTNFTSSLKAMNDPTDISQINTQTGTSTYLPSDEYANVGGIALTPSNNSLFTAPLGGYGFSLKQPPMVGSPEYLYPGVISDLTTEPVFTELDSMTNSATINQYGAFVN